MQMEMVPSELPQEIMFEILSRLPVKYLMQCKCVCRGWRALVNNPCLINMHLSLQAKSPSLLLETFSFARFGHCRTKIGFVSRHYKYIIENVAELGRTSQATTFLPMPSYRIIGSCNGLLCLSDLDDTVLSVCNPLTGKTLELPRSNSSPFGIGIGIGYHARNNNYKVAGLYLMRCLHETRVRAEVFTLGRSRSWASRGGDIPFLPVKGLLSVFVDGALHWLAHSPIHSTNRVIGSFNVGYEDFRVRTVPPQLQENKKCRGMKILELGGCLALVDFSCLGRIDVWKMIKGNGSAAETWTKQFVIGISETVQNVNLLMILKSGEVLVHYNKTEFSVYDPNCNLLRDIHNKVPTNTFRSFIHVGSLVSPYCVNDV